LVLPQYSSLDFYSLLRIIQVVIDCFRQSVSFRMRRLVVVMGVRRSCTAIVKVFQADRDWSDVQRNFGEFHIRLKSDIFVNSNHQVGHLIPMCR
jgi:hypothetical protein